MKRLLILITLMFAVQAGAAEKWKIASLEWPPFTGKTLPDGGAGTAILREALKAEGIELEIEFIPWSRAIKVAKDSSYVGYYPAWPEDVIDGFSKSDIIFKSPVGIAELVAKPLAWEKLEDLKGKKIGTVQDYGNTAEFNALVKSGVILTEVVTDDATNVRKIAAGRIDGAFIDLNNLEWMIKKEVKEAKGKVQANKKALGEKNLHLALNNATSTTNINDKLKKGLAKINVDKILSDYFSKHLK